jgi:hypothetical protein
MAIRKRRKTKWIQKAVKKPGALHRMLGIAPGEKIPLNILKSAAKKPGKLGQRARFALNMQKIRKNRK